MVKIKLLKDYLNKQVGQVIAVNRNIAHGLIESGVAVLGTHGYANRMMSAETKSEVAKDVEDMEDTEDVKKTKKFSYKTK